MVVPLLNERTNGGCQEGWAMLLWIAPRRHPSTRAVIAVEHIHSCAREWPPSPPLATLARRCRSGSRMVERARPCSLLPEGEGECIGIGFATRMPSWIGGTRGELGFEGRRLAGAHPDFPLCPPSTASYPFPIAALSDIPPSCLKHGGRSVPTISSRAIPI